jgi:uncharacterized protein DUF5047
MRPVSDAFLSVVQGSHEIIVAARVVEPGQSGTDPGGIDLDVIDGDVTFDSTAQVRGTLDLTVDGHGWTPQTNADPRQPYGNEIWVARGVRIGGGIELVSQGYFRITEVDQDESPHGDLRISGQDRTSAIVDDRFTAPRQFSAADTVQGVITTLVGETLPGIPIDYTADNPALGRSLTEDQDRYGVIKSLIDSVGAIMYFDHQGHLVVKPVPDITAPVWTVAGEPGGVLVQASRTLSRDGVYNAVVVSGEGADSTAAVTATAYDNDPNSPTYWYGSYGRVPGFYSSETITTTSQAAVAARAALRKVLGLPYSIDLTAVPNPALEAWDVIRVRYPNRSEVHLLEKVTIPLVATTAMTGTTRSGLPTTIEVS